MTSPVKVVDFSKKQDTTYCIDLHTRDRQVAENIKRIPGRIEPANDNDDHIAIVCYGPSLEDTWEQIKDFKYIITCSGAHKFLVDRGIIPTWHAEVDPRKHKALLIGTPHKDVTYLCASVCHEDVFDLLEGCKVLLWHVFSHETGRDGIPLAYPRGEWALTGGSNVGLRSMVLARFMGFKKMTIFGMDYSFKDGGKQQHAGPHPKEIPQVHAVDVEGELFYTNPAMHQYAQQFFDEVTKLGNGVEVNVVGEGMLQALIKEHVKTKPLIPYKQDPSLIAAYTPPIASKEHLEHINQLHIDSAYNVGSIKHLGVLKKLIKRINPTSILDYGCGKGTLAKILEIPIWEYDPGIPGKDGLPRPAEFVICINVLEHVEPEYLLSVMLDLSRCATKLCYVAISPDPSNLIQQGRDWWLEQLSTFFTVGKLDEMNGEIIALLGPKNRLKVKAE